MKSNIFSLGKTIVLKIFSSIIVLVSGAGLKLNVHVLIYPRKMLKSIPISFG